jgi:hypothetical protein
MKVNPNPTVFKSTDAKYVRDHSSGLYKPETSLIAVKTVPETTTGTVKNIIKKVPEILANLAKKIKQS